MKPTRLILTLAIIVSFMSVSLPSFANEPSGLKKQKENLGFKKETLDNQKSIVTEEAFFRMYLFYDQVTCPDGTIQYAGVFGYTVDDNTGQITSVYHDYWGEAIACEGHELIIWA